MGIVANDPIFLLLISTGRLEVMLQETPEALERLFKAWTAEIRQNYDLVEHSLIERQKLAIAQAASDLILNAEQQEARRFWGSLVPAAGVLLAVWGIGFLAGVTVPPWLQGGYVGQVKLTVSQAAMLQWAQSEEGVFARNIMIWNNGYLNNRECEKDAKRLILSV
ncbi:MAG: DUF6753 family protein [Nostocaceae cyanobacterium]|nr:DUF6753 family protein [Nostocaceae cyanobacterium]